MRRAGTGVAWVLAAALLGMCVACGSKPAVQPRPADEDRRAAQAAAAARRAYDAGDYARARVLYAQALTRARMMDAAELAADSAYNLALAEIGSGDYEAAAQHLREAEYDATRAAAATADIVLVRAKVAYLRQNPSEAAALADQVIATAPDAALRLQAHILRAQMRVDARALGDARAELQPIEQLLASPDTVVTASIAADAAKLNGTLARAEGRLDAAARFFATEADLLRSAHRYRDMGFALARLGETYLLQGEPALAADRYYLAARSLAASGDVATARVLLASSLSAAAKAEDLATRARAQALLQELSERAGP